MSRGSPFPLDRPASAARSWGMLHLCGSDTEVRGREWPMERAGTCTVHRSRRAGSASISLTFAGAGSYGACLGHPDIRWLVGTSGLARVTRLPSAAGVAGSVFGRILPDLPGTRSADQLRWPIGRTHTSECTTSVGCPLWGRTRCDGHDGVPPARSRPLPAAWDVCLSQGCDSRPDASARIEMPVCFPANRHFFCGRRCSRWTPCTTWREPDPESGPCRSGRRMHRRE